MRRRFFIPETIQTSAMDCGPAALKSLLDGCGIRSSYARLREACQTEIDGTSIDQMEDVAVQLGLEASQVMLPVDHLLDRGAKVLPAIVVVRNPDGAAHFVVVWRRHGDWLQVMDSAVGRRWMRSARFLNDVYVHTMSVPASAWREWAGSESFLATLKSRISRVGGKSDALVARASADAGPHGLSRLDAATRMTEALAARRVISRHGEAARVLETLVSGAMPIAEEYWSARLDGESVELKGGVLIQVTGTRTAAAAETRSPELASALAEETAKPWTEVFRYSFRGDTFTPSVVIAGLLCSAAAVTGEALLVRGLFNLGGNFTGFGDRVGGLTALGILGTALLGLEFSLRKTLLGLGRRLEFGLRARFQEKLPRLEDRYLRGRPISDLAERSHNIHQLRQAPVLAAQFLQPFFELALTTGAIAWVFPGSGFWPLGIAVVAIGIPMLAQPVLTEHDARMRTHSGTLTRFYLDALLGLTAIRCHDAGRGVRREQAALVEKWTHTGLALQRAITTVEAVQFGGTLLLAGWLVWSGVRSTPDPAGLLLLVYWVLNLPVLGQEAANALWQYPRLRNTTLRLLEPLSAKEDDSVPTASSSQRLADLSARSSSVPLTAPLICWQGVTVHAGGHVLLEEVDLRIEPGSHVAVVGLSGAGKSTLVGLLLGWHKPSRGSVLIDGEPLLADALARLRAATAWIDPQVQIWNRSLYDNLLYGGGAGDSFDEILQNAELSDIVPTLPQGVQTVLGEGGGLLSGGEGQRVRFGRGLARTDIRLAVLDEPARGLDRESRREMVRRARRRWRHATLICITHDVADTRDFDRVVVVEGARVLENGRPAELAATTTSSYRRMLDTEDALDRNLWSSSAWRHLRLEHGKLREMTAETIPSRLPLRGPAPELSVKVETPENVPPHDLGSRSSAEKLT